MTLCELCASLTIQGLYELAQTRAEDVHVSEFRNGAPSNAYYRHAQSYQSLIDSAQSCELCLAISQAFEESGIIHDVQKKEAKGQATDVKLWLETGKLFPTHDAFSGRAVRRLIYLAVQVGRRERSTSSSAVAVFRDDNNSDISLLEGTPIPGDGLEADSGFEVGIAALREDMLQQPKLSLGENFDILHQLEEDGLNAGEWADHDAELARMEDEWNMDQWIINPESHDRLPFFDALEPAHANTLKMSSISQDQGEENEALKKSKETRPESKDLGVNFMIHHPSGSWRRNCMIWLSLTLDKGTTSTPYQVFSVHLY